MKNSFTSSFYSQYLCFLDEFARRTSFQLYITILLKVKRTVTGDTNSMTDVMYGHFSSSLALLVTPLK